VTFINVAVNDGTPVNFVSGGQEGIPWLANVNVSCGGERFKVVIRFSLPQYSASCCTKENTRINVFSNGKFDFAYYDLYGYSWRFFPDTSPNTAPDTTPPLAVAFLRRNEITDATNNTLRILVGGSYQSHDSYSTPANVHLICQ
jgi:hypothetical protein